MNTVTLTLTQDQIDIIGYALAREARRTREAIDELWDTPHRNLSAKDLTERMGAKHALLDRLNDARWCIDGAPSAS